MYKILYIDEDIKLHRKFKRYTKGRFEVEAILPHAELTELLKYMTDSGADAAVIDHKLSEKKPDVNYDGAEVFRKYRKIKSNFPLFILTSFDSDAIAEAEDVNHVYPKNVINRSQGKKTDQATFNDRMKMQIEHYQKRLIDSETTFFQLIEKSSSEVLNAEEEATLIDLDGFLNGETNMSYDIPRHLKTASNVELTKELLAISEQLIQAVTKK